MEVLYQDEQIIAINKPAGLLVHPSRIARDANETALQNLRDFLGQYVYPVHRLDRKTAGVLVFALDKTTQASLSKLFREGLVEKTYYCIARGYIKNGVIDYALTNDAGKKQDAISQIECIEQVELPLPFGRYATSRYSLARLMPKTGRFHQLRKHLAHLRHPIIGDRPHGCNKQNRLFKERFGLMEMMLWAERIRFPTVDGDFLEICAPASPNFQKMLGELGFKTFHNKGVKTLKQL